MRRLNLGDIDIFVVLLLILGGLNWGLIGLFDFNLIEVVFVHIPVLEQVLYIFIGISSLSLFAKLWRVKK